LVQNPIRNEIRFQMSGEIKNVALFDLLGHQISLPQPAKYGVSNYLVSLDQPLKPGAYIFVVNGQSQVVIKGK